MQRENHNYAAAFLQYLEGRSFEEIAENSEIPLDTLKAQASHNGWGSLRTVYNEMHENQLVKPNIESSLVKMETNRQTNLIQAQKFQNVLDFALQQLAEEMQNGPKKYTVTVTDKKGNTRTETKIFERLTPKNIRDLSCAAATIHDLTYRALGDIPAKKDPNQSDSAPRAQIIVNIPSILAQPRDLTRVIEVSPETQSKDTES